MQVPFTVEGVSFFFRFKNASKVLLWSCTGAVVTHNFVIHSRHLLPSAPECLKKAQLFQLMGFTPKKRCILQVFLAFFL